MSRFRAGKRRSKRTKSVTPVRFCISGSKEIHLAHTLDVSDHGVMLGGFRGELKIGDKIEVQYHHKRAQFSVVWLNSRQGSSEKLVGARCLEPEKKIWGIDFPDQKDEYEEKD
jgi:hypothetical protein